MDAVTKTKDGPDLWNGLSFSIEEIEIGHRVIAAKLRELKKCADAKQQIPAKLCADDIERVSGQVQILASVVAKVLAEHINRRVRNHG